MKKLCYYLWIFLLINHYGQTQFIEDDDDDDDIDPLSMDEAYLIIKNKNYYENITVKHNMVVCEKCDFDILAYSIADNKNKTVIVNTRYTHDFEIYLEHSDTPLSCEITSYHFSDGATYLFEISKTRNNQTTCSLNPTKDEQNIYYWLPIIIGSVVLILFILLTQIWHCISENKKYSRLLPNVVQQGLASNELPLSAPRSPNLITNDPNDDIINTLMTSTDLTLTGPSSRALIGGKKAIPKRLRSLDAFRGFSLMVMIFVNYGGKICFFFSPLYLFLFIKEVVIGSLNIRVSFILTWFN